MTLQFKPWEGKRGGLRGYVCGFGSAFLNISITFPLNKVMFRQMLHGVNSQSAIHQLRKEGFRFLYRGVGPPLAQKTISMSIMFGSFEDFQPRTEKYLPSLPPVLVVSVAGSVAGIAEAFFGTPFERVQTLIQDRKYHSVYRNSGHALKDLMQYGVTEYYRGLLPIIIRNTLSNILYFNAKDEVFKFLPSPNSTIQLYTNLFLSGAVTGAVSSTIFYPLNVVKTSMQACCGTPRVSLRDAFVQVYNERGRSVRKLYLGVHMNYTRSFLSWGVMNSSYELLRKILYDEDELVS